MAIFQWCKTQIMAIMVLAYVEFVFVREERALDRLTKKSGFNPLFDYSLNVANLAVLFDGITACTVNLPAFVPRKLNLFLHYGMFACYETYMALLFWYWISVTLGLPRQRWKRICAFLFNGCILLATALWMPGLKFVPGQVSSYSAGRAVDMCFFSILLHLTLTMVLLAVKQRELPTQKKMSLFATVFFIAVILGLQIAFPQTLLSSIAVVMIVLAIYLNMENPTIRGLEHYQNEMVMGFATMVENKDDSTGGHIRRSSAYVKLIAQNLKKNKKYRPILTHDYINHLEQSAPMHDIGKIGVPDAILQKPERLTDEEFEIMKGHTVAGGNIIRETFGHLFDGAYETMAFQVARFHHEKWNGEGYPDGLKGTEIPLCARIMSVADVFDAISTNRCYRKAIPLKECYDVIRRGSGVDFDPDVVEAFLMDTNQVERIYEMMNDSSLTEVTKGNNE